MFEPVAEYSVAIVAVQSAMRPADLQQRTDGPSRRGRGAHFSTIRPILRQIQRHAAGPRATRTRHGVHSIAVPRLI